MAAPVKEAPAGGSSPTVTANSATVKKPLLFRPCGSMSWFDAVLVILGILSAVGAGVPFPIMGIVFGELVDKLNKATCEAAHNGTSTSQAAAVHAKVIQLVYVSLAAFALNYIYTSTWSLLSRRLSHKLREAYFRALLRQDATFFDSRHAGEVSARLNGDIQTIATGTGEKVGLFLASVSFFCASYVVGFIKVPALAGILISMVPAYLLMSTIGGFYLQKFATIASDRIASGSKVVSEALDNVAVVQTFRMRKRLEAKFASDMFVACEAGIKKAFVSATQAGLLFFIAYSANALAFWEGSRRIAKAVQGKGSTTVGQIYTVVFLLVDACIVLASVAPLLPLFGGAASAYGTLRDDITKISAIDGTSGAGGQAPLDTPGALQLQNVSFAYPSRPEHMVIKSLTLSIPAGKHTGVVGLSGSGKSTIASLVSRLYDPSFGTVLLDGNDIKDYNVRSLRGLIGIVPQEPSLLDRSVFENIALGLINSSRPEHQALHSALLNPKFSKVASQLDTNAKHDAAVTEIINLVREAAEMSEVNAFIGKLEHGWATRVGSGGHLVSGGQRQRIALARALVKNPKILVLDEATASLDSVTERKIQESINRVAAYRTVISIAHRLSTIKDVDNVVVMKAGEIIEQGSYNDLLASDGALASMVKLQNIGPETGRSSTSSSVRSQLDEKIDTTTVGTSGISTPMLETPFAADEHANAKKNKELEKLPLLPIAKMLGRLSAPSRPWLCLAIGTSFIVGCAFPSTGLLFGNTVGALSPCGNTVDHILWAGRFFGGMFFLVGCVELLANLSSWSSFGIVAERLVYRVRVLAFRSLFEKGITWHRSNGRSPTALLELITKDSVALHSFSGSMLGTICSVIVNFIVAVTVSHIIAWKIALVFFVTVPILIGSGVMQLRAISSFEKRHAANFSAAVSITVEAVAQIKTIAMLGLEEESFQAYKRALSGPKNAIVKASLYTNIWLALANSTGFLIHSFAYWWGSKLIMQGEYTQKQFLIVLVAILVSAQLWGQMFSLAPEVLRAKNAAGRLLALIAHSDGNGMDMSEDLHPDKIKLADIEATAESPAPASKKERGITIVFDNVSFVYPSRPGAPVLNNVSFRVSAGQFVGLVGPSGAGKSTIMALVQRLYTPSSGLITLDGMSSSNGGGDAFVDDVAVVPQDASLFSGSVAFNIGLGARAGHVPSLDDVREACRLANIDDVIMALPDGYNTDCGPAAARLSGGQKQRLAIARALVRKPRLLLLDESTSALDAESEAAVQDGLTRVVRERGITVLAITHRLHTVMKADNILVVDGGVIVDKGIHSELVERCESYRRNALGQAL